MVWFRLCSSWITVDDMKSRGQGKHVKLSSKLNSLFNQGMSFKQASYLFVPSLFCFSRKMTSKNLSLPSCFVKSNFCWQSAEIRFPYHLGFKYAKWLALSISIYLVNYDSLTPGLKESRLFTWLKQDGATNLSWNKDNHTIFTKRQAEKAGECFYKYIFFSPLMYNHTTFSQLYYKYPQNLQRLHAKYVSKNNWIESEKYCQENVGQEHYASIISQTQYICLLTGKWQQ